jgi:serine/threonine protein kinase
MKLHSDMELPTQGSLIGPWRVLKRVGSGGNGIVYRACLAKAPNGGTYAVKLAREPRAPRFELEAELLSRIDHPNVPRLIDRGLWRSPWGSEYPYLVMQWVEGMPLYRWAAERALTSRQALLLLAQVARALEATHRHGAHRSVKGDNVLVAADGHAVLLGYGGCWYDRGEPKAHAPAAREDDVYALGVTAYQLVTGTYPSPGVSPHELATVLPELEAIIQRMLSEKREERGTPGELARVMSEAAQRAGPEADRRVRPARMRLPPLKAPQSGKPRWYGLRKRPRWPTPG